MLNFLIRLSLNHRLFVLAIAGFCMVYGSIVILNTAVDVLPDLNRPVVTVLTEAPGMAPEEVETFVTKPLEAALSGLSGIDRVRSVSGATLSIVYLDFAWGTDIYKNRQLVTEKLSLMEDQLPAHVTPVIGPITSLLGEIQLIGLTSKEQTISPMDLRTFADRVLRPKLLAVQGVAQIMTMGGEVKQYDILIAAEKVRYYQLALDDLENHLTDLSLNTTGGFLRVQNQEVLLRNLGSVHTVEDIENSVVGMHLGKPVLVKDIAKVKIGAQQKRGDASINGLNAVLLAIHKQPNVNTLDLTARIDEAILEIGKTLPTGMELHQNLLKQADFISQAISNVVEVLNHGAIAVSILLFLFLLNIRTTLISLTAIPLSFILTFIFFKMFGLTINTMTLGGLAIAIGELVDDAIVDVENVNRRLQENRLKNNPISTLKVIFLASAEVRNSIVFATMIVLFVFLPLFFLSGIEGSFFKPLGIAYVVSLMASLVISLTVTPVLCSFLLGKKANSHEKVSILVRILKQWNGKILAKLLDKPKTTIGMVVVLFIASLGFLPFMGTAFLPPLLEPTALFSIIARPGICLASSCEIGQAAEKIILQTADVVGVSRRTGRAEADEHAEGVHASEIDVYFKKDIENRAAAINEIRQNLLTNLKEVFINVEQPISHRIDHLISGINSQIALKIYGYDLSKLSQRAAQVLKAVQDIPGLVDVQQDQQIPVQENKIYIMRDLAAAKGVVVGDLTRGLEMAFNGKKVAQLYDDERNWNVVARFDENSRSDLEAIKRLPVKLMPNGERVLLEDIADIYAKRELNVINRENSRRRITIQANATGRDIGSLVADIQERIKQQVKFEPDESLEYDGQYKQQQQASKTIFWLALLSLLSIFLLLASHFSSAWLSIQVMLCVPLAMMGAFAALYLTDRTWSIASLIGLITLCGIASRNSIMMISHFLHLMKEEGESFNKEMIIRGAQERLSPVLMTSLSAILGLIPLVFDAGEPGKEILHPLSVVIVGGLISSTLINLVLTPLIFYNYGEKAALKSLKVKESV